jgi:hypothetical protein
MMIDFTGIANWDKTKLQKFKSELRYQHALFIRFQTGRAPDYTPALEWIETITFPVP